MLISKPGPRAGQTTNRRTTIQAVIDGSVPNASKYYATYLREPSPAGVITLAAQSIATVKDLDFERILTEMKTIGADGEVMIVTHSGPKGFLMPLKTGGKVALMFSVIDKLPEIAEGIRRREAIRSMSSSQLAAAWKKWFADFESGIKLGAGFENNEGWQKQVETWYDDWYERQGKQILKLPNPRQDLKNLLDLLADVRKLNFKRVEFRACRIGTDKSAMKKIAEFLGAKKVVGPKEVRTFYGVIAGVSLIADAKKFSAAKKKLGGRTFPGISLAMQILQNTFRVIATDAGQLKAFITTYISSNFSGSTTPFVIGGLEPSGKAVLPAKAHVFPLETEYMSLLEEYDAGAVAGAGATP